MKNFIVMFMAFCGWGVFILSCTGEIDNSSKIMAFAPLLAIPQLVRFYGCWEKKRKKGSFLLQLALGGLLAGGGLLCLLPFSLWSGKETIWAQTLLIGCVGWGAVFLLLELINRSVCKIVDCLEEMYLK